MSNHTSTPETKRDEPAFPGGYLSVHPGLSIRDYFAAAALSAFLSNPHVMDELCTEIDRFAVPDERRAVTINKVLAKRSYMQADAMIAHRSEIPQTPEPSRAQQPTAGESAPAGKHTPGPWKVDVIGRGKWAIICRSELLDETRRTEIVAEITDTVGYLPLDENRANARLIAAAPELLDQLKFIADAYNRAMLEKGYTEDSLLTGRYGRAIEAIAKATGRAS